MDRTDVLYKRDATGNIIHWRCEIKKIRENCNNHIVLAYYYGRLNSTVSVSYSDRIVAKSKKTNMAQAEFEMNSIFERHRKKGYKSLKDLGIFNTSDFKDSASLYNLINLKLPKYNTDANNCAKPMKAQKFAIGKFEYPCIIQPKINGVRAIIMLEEFVPTDLFSTEGFIRKNKYYKTVIKTKEGLEYNIPHIKNLFNELYNKFPEYSNIIFDGEIYIRNEKVTSIGGAARNIKNPLHKKLQFVNFDLSIPDISNKDRDVLRFKIWEDFNDTNVFVNLNPQGDKLWDNFKIIVLNSDVCWDDNQALKYMQESINNGFEGAIIRNNNAEYKFGSRPATMMKLKKFDDAEFKCVGINHFGNPDDGVGFSVTLTLKNDINDLTFDCTLMGTVNERLEVLSNPPIGKIVTVKFYERTKNGLPFHANIVGIRDYE